MSFLNFGFNLITYEDQNITNPTVRSVDVVRTMNGVPVTGERTDRVSPLRPGESLTVASTSRSLLQDNTTAYNILRPVSDDVSTVRLIYSGGGTAPMFAVKRELGLTAVSSVAISRVNPATARVTCVGMNTSTVQVGDVLKFEKSNDLFSSVFSVINQNEFQVVSKGLNYIDVLENGVMSVETAVLGAAFDFQIRCFRASVVKVGDTIEINGTGQNPMNCGKFEVKELSHDYVQFINPYAVESAFVNTDNVFVYDGLVGFVCIRANGVVSVKINNGAPFKITRIGGNEAVFVSSLSAFKIELINEEQVEVSATVHYSRYM